MVSNEIIARTAAKMRFIASEIRAYAGQLLEAATRARTAANTLELMASDLEPPPETPESDRSSHRS